MAENSQEKPKILVDSDWKAKVEAEKEELRRREGANQAPGDADAIPGVAEDERLPPASFELLVTSLATQAMVALGQVPDPIENKRVVVLPLARHQIDLLGMLEEKTKGNLTAGEQALLAHVLTDLRMEYVTMESRVKAAK